MIADPVDRLHAIQQLARDGAAVLEPLRHAPFSVADWTAPETTDDEDQPEPAV